MPHVVWVDELNAEHQPEVRELLRAVRASDGRPDPGPGGGLPEDLSTGPYALAYRDAELVGFAQLDQRGDAFGREVAELFVHPEHRGRGHGGSLAAAVTERASRTLRYWSHGDHPAAARIARRAGLRRVRELLRMRADLTSCTLDEPRLPADVRVRTFVPGQDERAVIDVNARAFAWHPEQGALTVGELRETEQQDWFDPEGFFLAEEPEGSAGGLLGFHWTKVHPPDPDGRDVEVGEVYVVGVDPRAHGRGLGTALTLAGLRYLDRRGLREVILYVEGDNPAAITVYNRLGFGTESTDVQYELAR
ncbi:mycothiol synthase [Haloechinothrix sp. YIM 98757]|uniref:Mycothiol acetyltransferase n=1 Tax=Haloechinothrix aidingensis TaxID=2752311 RepID=A0A838A491_9PSEU|nr:mycothiol synthase [Haloechinothrix aidingensis]MBA0124410.1 mycothiol synthase [Haloechinothrix aidingensis]